MMRSVPLGDDFFEKKETVNKMKNNKAKDNDRISDLIDQNLKMVYSDLAEEKLPDRFKDLLDVLAAQDVELKDKK
ncbi:MAG: hypothetical protein ACJAVM_002916 [Sulfitobacter sp.]|jgi:hypothetical protein